MAKSRRNVIANYAGTAWSALMQLGFVPVYLHILGPEAYGLIGFYTTMQIWFTVADFGLTPTLTREFARLTGGAIQPREAHVLFLTLELACLAIAAAGFLLVAGGSHWLSLRWLTNTSLGRDTVSQSIALMGAVAAIRWMSNFYRGGLFGLQRQVLLNGVNVVFSTLRSAGVLLPLLLYSKSITVYFLWQVIISLAEAVALRIAVMRITPPAEAKVGFSGAILRHHLHFAGGMTLISISGALLSQLDKLLLSKNLPLAVFGYYMIATTAANTLMMLMVPVYNALYPRFSELVARDDVLSLRAAYERGTQAVSIIVIPAAMVLVLFGATVIRVWTSDPQAAAQTTSVTALLALGCLFQGLMHLPYALQLAFGWTRLTNLVNLISILIMIPALLLTIPRYGMVAAAVVWMLINLAYLVFQVPYVHARLLPGVSRSWYLNDILKPLVASLAFLVPTKALFLLAPKLVTSLYGQLAIITLAGILSVAAAAGATPLGRETACRLLKKFRKET